MSSELHDLAAGYALHALDPSEEHAFEAHLATCERCREQVAEFRETAAVLAYDSAPKPLPEMLERRILTAARAERPNVVPLRQRLAVPAAALAAAAAVAAIGLAVWGTHLSRSLDRERSARTRDAEIMSVLSEPNAERVAVRGGSGTLVVAPSRKGVLIVNNLPAAPHAKTYEAWVVKGNRTKRAGLFAGGAGWSIILLKRHVPKGAKVGVTLEKAGGVDQPSGVMLVQASLS